VSHSPHVTTLRVGFAPIARTTFDIPLAAEAARRMRAALEDAGFAVAGSETLITTQADAQAAVSALSGEPLDALLVFHATFVDSTLSAALAGGIDAPLALWAPPEPRTGERLRSNALCGITLSGHALKRAGRVYEAIYAPPGDPAALDRLAALARAGRARRVLRGARIGRIGVHPDGFETCSPHAEALRETFGVRLIQLELDALFEQARAADPAAVDAVADDLRTRLANLDAVDPVATRSTLSAYVALRDLVAREGFTALAVRCWPHFFTELGGAACGALALLADDHIPASCEADVNGTLTQLLLQAISGGPAFDTDLVDFDLDDETVVVWHCGKAPLSMADPAVAPRAAAHPNRVKPLLMEFPLKPGRVTLARISEATGAFRLVVGAGEMLAAPMSFTGTSGVLRFDRPARAVLDTLLGEGLEHHMALAYGDHVDALLAFARLVDIPVLRL